MYFPSLLNSSAQTGLSLTLLVLGFGLLFFTLAPELVVGRSSGADEVLVRSSWDRNTRSNSRSFLNFDLILMYPGGCGWRGL